jgi:hypothetical protein
MESAPDPRFAVCDLRISRPSFHPARNTLTTSIHPSHLKAKRLGLAARSSRFRHERAWCVVLEQESKIVGYAVWSREFSTWLATEYLLYVFVDSRR